MSSEKEISILEKARIYESEAVKKIPAGQKPRFHVAVPTGWSNDPNGFSYYRGKYHLFFQYNPYTTKFGHKHWGHCTTEDFVNWEYLPAAIAPDSPYDKNGCFSGSAIEHEGKHVLMYTGVRLNFKDPADEIFLEQNRTPENFRKMMEEHRMEPRQIQCIAVGDGLNYEKIQENPVITSDMLPENSDISNFRDPKVWKEDGIFYAVIGGQDQEKDGQILLYSSKDLKQWKYEGILYKNHGECGEMWECPDFFQLDGKYVLLSSPIDIKGDGITFSDGSGSVCAIGTYDKKKHVFHKEYLQMIEYGPDYYAPQSTEAKDGRRILIGWMEKFNNYLMPEGYQWYGMMTIPRELSIRDGKLYQLPVRELKNYYKNPVRYEKVSMEKEAELEGIKGRYLDMTVETEAGDYTEFAVEIAADQIHKTVVRYNKKDGLLTIDRSESGMKNDKVPVQSARVRTEDGKLQLRLLIDNCALEVFANGGEQVMSALVYTPETADGIRFTSDGHVVFGVEKYDIKN